MELWSADADPDAKEDSAESEEEDKSEEDQETSKATVAKINQQPAKNLPSGRYDPNRYCSFHISL